MREVEQQHIIDTLKGSGKVSKLFMQCVVRRHEQKKQGMQGLPNHSWHVTEMNTASASALLRA